MLFENETSAATQRFSFNILLHHLNILEHTWTYVNLLFIWKLNQVVVKPHTKPPGSNDGIHWTCGSAFPEVPWLRKFTGWFLHHGQGRRCARLLRHLPFVRNLGTGMEGGPKWWEGAWQLWRPLRCSDVQWRDENEGAQQRTYGYDLCARYLRGRMCNRQRCDSAVRLLSCLTLFSSIPCTVLHLRDSLCEFRPCGSACRPSFILQLKPAPYNSLILVIVPDSTPGKRDNLSIVGLPRHTPRHLHLLPRRFAAGCCAAPMLSHKAVKLPLVVLWWDMGTILVHKLGGSWSYPIFKQIYFERYWTHVCNGI